MTWHSVLHCARLAWEMPAHRAAGPVTSGAPSLVAHLCHYVGCRCGAWRCRCARHLPSQTTSCVRLLGWPPGTRTSMGRIWRPSAGAPSTADRRGACRQHSHAQPAEGRWHKTSARWWVCHSDTSRQTHDSIVELTIQPSRRAPRVHHRALCGAASLGSVGSGVVVWFSTCSGPGGGRRTSTCSNLCWVSQCT